MVFENNTPNEFIEKVSIKRKKKAVQNRVLKEVFIERPGRQRGNRENTRKEFRKGGKKDKC